MVYLLKMVIFHGYVSHNQMVYTAAASKFEECSMIQLIIARGSTTQVPVLSIMIHYGNPYEPTFIASKKSGGISGKLSGW